MKPVAVIFHRADYDGIFCREIALRFFGENAEYIGWDFGDVSLPVPSADVVYVMDLPVDRVFGFKFPEQTSLDLQTYQALRSKLVWIDHHKSSIETHPKDIHGYRIDGVAACRLAWQWFTCLEGFESAGNPNAFPIQDELPDIFDFKDRRVVEPMAVRLAGEYDVWDHRDEQEDIAFQFGLDSQDGINWHCLLDIKNTAHAIAYVDDGRKAMQCYAKRDADVMRERSFVHKWGDYKFLTLNTPRCNSNTFKVRDVPETGHDALMAYFWNGRAWQVSMYHAAHRKDLDLSQIAKANGGGGHAGACGFTAQGMYFVGDACS